jgi:zinc-binding in reverse transcriptase
MLLGVNQFKKQLVDDVYREYQSMLALLSNVTLCEAEMDKIVWRHNSTGRFTIHFFYLWLDNGGVISKDFDIIWHTKIPLKIQIFMWLVRKNKILTKKILLKRG